MAFNNVRHRRPSAHRDLSENQLTVDAFLQQELLLNFSCSAVDVSGNNLGFIEHKNQSVQNQEGSGKYWESHEDFHKGKARYSIQPP